MRLGEMITHMYVVHVTTPQPNKVVMVGLRDSGCCN